MVKNVEFHSKTHMVETPCSNPYETCRLWSLLRHFSQNGLKKYQKSIRFSLKVDAVSRIGKTSKNR